MNENDLGLSYLHIASGLITGRRDDIPSGAISTRPLSHPRAVLEARILEALKRPPCVVAFSGGLDSSSALALAAHVARREGLPLPHPVSLRYLDVPESEERRWQERVVRHLKLETWETIDVSKDDLDMLGPTPQTYLRRHGLLYPNNFYYLLPAMERARGGAFVTGWDGDGIFRWWRWNFIARVLRGRHRPSRRELMMIPYMMLPVPLRRYAAERRQKMTVPWLTKDAEQEILRLWANDTAEEPARWDKWLDWYGNHRLVRAIEVTFHWLAEDFDAVRCDLFRGSDFLNAIGRAHGATGPLDRNHAFLAMFQDLLPRSVLERRDKAEIAAGFWGKKARKFISEWDGEHVDPAIVNIDALKRLWHSGEPLEELDMTATLAHETWLRSGQPINQRIDGELDVRPMARPD